MYVILKYIGFGLMFVFLGFIGVGVSFYYIVKKMLEQDDAMDADTADWNEKEDRQPNTL